MKLWVDFVKVVRVEWHDDYAIDLGNYGGRKRFVKLEFDFNVKERKSSLVRRKFS